MPTVVRCLSVTVLLVSLLTGCNAQPADPATPADQTPTDEPATSCTYEQVTYPDGFTFGVDGGVARCSGRIDGLCVSGPATGRSCTTNEDCHTTCTNGVWK